LSNFILIDWYFFFVGCKRITYIYRLVYQNQTVKSIPRILIINKTTISCNKNWSNFLEIGTLTWCSRTTINPNNDRILWKIFYGISFLGSIKYISETLWYKFFIYKNYRLLFFISVNITCKDYLICWKLSS